MQPPAIISVIIPIWRDLDALGPVMSVLRESPEIQEVIVSLADATPEAIRKIEEMGAKCVDVGKPSRGRQLDAGAAAASGTWLLFHHVDTEITRAHVEALAELNQSPEILGGAFYRKFDERHPMLRWLEPVERWHNRTFGALYGDQSIFARRKIFSELGGFRNFPLMEDVDFSLRLRRAGKIALLNPSIASSPRKHLARGPWKTTCKNASILLLYRLGVSPQKLHAWYYG